jgi:glycosyltransferase involved in cell wall biosynthesis
MSVAAPVRNLWSPRNVFDFIFIHARQAARGSFNAVRSKQTLDMWEKHGCFRVPLRFPLARFRAFAGNQPAVAGHSVATGKHLAGLPAIDFDKGKNAVLFADSHWNRRPILASLKQQVGNPFSIGFCHDVIPVERADFVSEKSRQDFLLWIGEMQRNCDQILCNSVYSAGRLRANFLPEAPQLPVRSVRFGNALAAHSVGHEDRKSLAEILSGAGIRHTNLSPLAAVSKEWLLWVGSLDVRKNLDVLLMAVEGLLSRGEMKRPVVLVGRPSIGYAYYLNKIARHPALHKYIVHIEAAPDSLMHDLQKQAALFLFTSWAEGYGLPVAEALQAGIPVIASNATSIPEVAGDLVDYFEPWNSGQLAGLIERFESDPAYRADLKARAARFVPTDWNETIDDIISGLPAGAA